MNDLLRLYRLQEIDLEIFKKRTKIRDLEGRLGETEEIHKARTEAKETELRLAELRRRSKEMEDKLASVRDKAKATEDKLYSGKVRNPREIESMQELLTSLKKRRSELEDSLLELMMEIEELDAIAKERNARLEDLRSAWEVSQSQIKAMLEEEKADLADLEDRQSRLRSSIPQALLEEYDYLVPRKGGMAIAKVVNGTCGVCGTILPPAVVSKLRAGEIVHCGGCGRLLLLA